MYILTRTATYCTTGKYSTVLLVVDYEYLLVYIYYVRAGTLLTTEIFLCFFECSSEATINRKSSNPVVATKPGRL